MIFKDFLSQPNTSYPRKKIRHMDFTRKRAFSQPNTSEPFDWQTATYGKIKYCEDEDDSFTNYETEYPAIVFNDTSDATLSCEPTVSPFNENKIDFRISFDESDDEYYMVNFDENSFSYKIISVDNLKTDSENENDKINMPSFPSPELTISHSDDLDFFKDFEDEFPAITYNDDLIKPSESFQHIEVSDLRQLCATYESAIKGLVGATAGIHQLSHATDHPGSEPALISKRSSNISLQPHNAPSQLWYLLLELGNPLLYSPRGRYFDNRYNTLAVPRSML
nr:hypothetical protein [Tanacetum cinerariifolium]